MYLVGFPIDLFAFILLLFRSFMFWVLLCCQLTGPPNTIYSFQFEVLFVFTSFLEYFDKKKYSLASFFC